MATFKGTQDALGPRSPTPPLKDKYLLIQGVLWGHWGERGGRDIYIERERRYVGGSRGRWAWCFHVNENIGFFEGLLWWTQFVQACSETEHLPCLDRQGLGLRWLCLVTVWDSPWPIFWGLVHHCTNMLEKSQTSSLPECKPRPRPSLALVFLSLTICFCFGVGLLWSTWPPKINGSP